MMRKKTLIKVKTVTSKNENGDKFVEEIIESNYNEKSGFLNRLWWKKHKKRKTKNKMAKESRKRNRGK